ncbi:IclR family transcriptional regulator [Natrialbaceae archaeon GCM10025810]|uniref:IclR family transcriptional regulator n=1 Tax=Halovalidus salilacus TaxID=3075124 RepID=UPI00360F45F9
MGSQYKRVKTAENIFTIIETIAALDQPTCSELAEHVDLSISSVYNYLKTLENGGFVIENGGRYRLSLKFLQLGREIRNSYPIMHAAVEPVDILAKAIDEYISVFVREGEKAVMVYEANSHHAVQVPTPFLGEPFHLARTPQGKVILAHMPDTYKRKITTLSSDEPIDEELKAELETIRAEGVWIDSGQTHEKIWAVAAPVEADGEIHGSLMISTVRHRITDQRAKEELPAMLDQTVREVEHRLSQYNFANLSSPW